MFDERLFDEGNTMSFTQISHLAGARTRRASGGGSARPVHAAHEVQGSSALWAGGPADSAAAPVEGRRPRLVEEQGYGAPSMAPAPVRALPVAVPLRHRPAHPVRTQQGRTVHSALGRPAVAGEGRTAALWADVRPWGVEEVVQESRPAPRRVRGAKRAQAGPAQAGRPNAQARAMTTVRRGARPWSAAVALGGIASVALGVGLALAQPVAQSEAQSATAPEGTVVAVQAGETLWDVARAHTPGTEDVRDTVVAIAEANGLRDGAVQAGQVLTVPSSHRG